MSDTTVFTFAGLPGAGKTTAMETAADTLNDLNVSAVTYEISEYVRSEFWDERVDDESQIREDISDNDLGHWAASKKDEYGRGHFAQRLSTYIGKNVDVALVSGVRSPEEIDAFRTHGYSVVPISIWSLPELRFKRLQEREGSYDRDEFVDRKERELFEWDCLELFTNSDYYNHIVPNNYSEEQFKEDVRYIVSSKAFGNRDANIYNSSPFGPCETNGDVAQYL